MCRPKNLDYEILKAMDSRKPELMDESNGALSLLKLFQTLGQTAEQLDALEKRAEYLEADGLIKMCTGGTWRSISSITPEGRALLDRLENNRWQNRLRDGGLGLVVGLVGGLLLAGLIKWLGLS